MKEKVKYIFGLLSVPLTFLVIYLTFVLLWYSFSLPGPLQLIDLVKVFFVDYGLFVVFFGSLIEGFLLLGQYFPGGFIIFLGVISAGKDYLMAMGVVFVVSLAFFISYTLNYFIGKYGFFKLFEKFGIGKSLEKAKKKSKNHIFKAIMLSYWEPNLASLTAVAAGILNVPIKKFLFQSLIGIIIWNFFWGNLIYFWGEESLNLMMTPKYGIIIFLLWISIILFFAIIEKLRSNK